MCRLTQYILTRIKPFRNCEILCIKIVIWWIAIRVGVIRVYLKSRYSIIGLTLGISEWVSCILIHRLRSWRAYLSPLETDMGMNLLEEADTEVFFFWRLWWSVTIAKRSESRSDATLLDWPCSQVSAKWTSWAVAILEEYLTRFSQFCGMVPYSM